MLFQFLVSHCLWGGHLVLIILFLNALATLAQNQTVVTLRKMIVLHASLDQLVAAMLLVDALDHMVSAILLQMILQVDVERLEGAPLLVPRAFNLDVIEKRAELYCDRSEIWFAFDLVRLVLISLAEILSLQCQLFLYAALAEDVSALRILNGLNHESSVYGAQEHGGIQHRV